MRTVFGIFFILLALLSSARVFSVLSSGEAKAGMFGTIYSDVNKAEFWGYIVLGIVFSGLSGIVGLAILLGWSWR
jgi:hypothetical protein